MPYHLGANVCISGAYVHREGFSPCVSPYNLRLSAGAPVTSLPSTSTLGPVIPGPVSTALGALALLGAASGLIALRAPRR